MIELLVVLLILGVLAAIVIPTMLSQKPKADDAVAKTMARTAQTAAETSATENNGSYTAVTPAMLKQIEPALNDTSSAWLSAASGTASGFTVIAAARAPDTNTFTITRSAGGSVSRSCATAGSNGCPANGSW